VIGLERSRAAEPTARVEFFRRGASCRILSDRSARVAHSFETVEHQLELEIELCAEVIARPQYMFDRELIEIGEDLMGLFSANTTGGGLLRRIWVARATSIAA
jgi:hypothetical protein